MKAPDCIIFMDADVSANELIGMIARMMFLDAETIPPCEADLINNEDYDSVRRSQFPDGFIYFRYRIEVFCEGAALTERIALVGRVLEQLWEWGFPAVAACDYEKELPHGGGYKSDTIPWP
jgi:hypothetical protein